MFQKLSNMLLGNSAAQEDASIALENEGGIPRDDCPPMSNLRYEYTSNLQYKVRSLGARVKAFETGEKYTEMKAGFKIQLSEKDRDIRGLKSELAQANAQIVTVRRNWSEIFDDLEKEHAKELADKDRIIKALEKKLLETQQQLDAEKGRRKNAVAELYQVKVELEDEKGKNQKLKAQISRDHENSSLPSSANPNRKKITNSRVKTGKTPGGQPGHEGHGRRWHEPTNRIIIPAPAEYAGNPMYIPTGNIICKQMVGLHVEVVVDEYSTLEFRHAVTGQLVHAEFPEGMANEVTYGGSVKAFAFLLNNHYNVAIDKVSDMISEITRGKLNLSHGMVCGLSKQFSAMTEAWQKKAFADMLLSPVMNVDFTSARVNGEKMNVLVCADGINVLYFARVNKGHKGVAGSPIEEYMHTMVHDHEITFYSYGGNHQECLDHVARYLKDSMQNEARLKWNVQMRDLIREMIHFRKHLDPADIRDPDQIDCGKVSEFERRYDEILETARAEYEYEPPSDYYKEGFNLYKRLEKYKSNHLLFLHDRRVPYSNSLAERLLRVYKRKEHQVMAFRSFGGLDHLCSALGAVASLREQGKNLYDSVAMIFDTQADSAEKTAS